MGLTFREIHDSEIPEFEELAKTEIGNHYPDIDDSFAQNIVQAHENPRDPLGYFTKTKTIWAGEVRGEAVGYIVGTEKRGGSVKISPILVKEPHRRRGHGTQLWQRAEEHYRSEGHRKLYTHAPLYRVELLKWFSELGANIEAILSEQYDAGQDEFIMGKMLKNQPQLKLPSDSEFSAVETEFEIAELRPTYHDGFRELIQNEMTQWYDEIDDSFVDGIIRAQERMDEGYRKKGKVVYIVIANDTVHGCSVATPKRGGSVKLVPMLFSDDATPAIVRALLQRIQNDFEGSHRKLYMMLPHLQTNLLRHLQGAGFEIEGFLQAPYKPNIDNVFLGKAIDEGIQ